MNISITTSFVIGGLLLLSMLAMNMLLINESSRTTMQLSNEQSLDNLREIITEDFNHIGFKPSDKGNSPSITSFNPPQKINFFANAYELGGQIIKWQFLDHTKDKDTPNPHDYILQRNGPIDGKNGSDQQRFAVVDFSLTGYSDIRGDSVTTDKDKIRSILVEVVYESPEPMGKDGNGNDEYYRTVWQKLFVPSNIQIHK